VTRSPFRRRPCRGGALPPWVVPIAVPTPYPVGPVTLYLLDGDPLTLVDTGPATRTAWRKLVRGLQARGYAPRDVQRVLVTHGHHDHFGAASRLARLGAEVHVHPHDANNLLLRRDYPRRWRRLRRSGLSVGRTSAILFSLFTLDLTTRRLLHYTPLADGEALPHENDSIRVHHTPGHSPGHVAFELEREGVWITGDTLLDGITPNAVVEEDPEDPARLFLSIAAYNRSLALLEEAAPALILPAHGRCLDDVAHQVAVVRTKQAQRAAQVRSALEAGPASVARLVETLFPHVSLLGTFLAYSEVLGHLLELERLGAVVQSVVGGREHWALSS